MAIIIGGVAPQRREDAVERPERENERPAAVVEETPSEKPAKPAAKRRASKKKAADGK